MKDVPTKATGDQWSAAEFNLGTNDELKNSVESVGIALSESDLFQLAKAIASYASFGDYFIDSGAADAYVLSAIGSRKAPESFEDGMRLRFTPINTNTGASTVNPFALGVKGIKHESGRDLFAGEILAGKQLEITYKDSAGYFILSDIVVEKYPPRHIAGLRTENNGADPLHDIDFGSGSCRDTNDIINMDLFTSITKRIDASWSEGTGNGGFPSALSISPDTWYHLFVIGKVDGTVDAGFDSATDASNLLNDATGYTAYRRVGSILTDGSSNITSYRQGQENIDYFFFNSFKQDVNDTNPGTTIQYRTMSVPLGVEVVGLFSLSLISSSTISGNVDINVLHPGVNDQFTGAVLRASYHAPSGASNDSVSKVDILTNTLSQIKYILDTSHANTVVTMYTRGWIDPRGK
jgi:hypothetical protein